LDADDRPNSLVRAATGRRLQFVFGRGSSEFARRTDCPGIGSSPGRAAGGGVRPLVAAAPNDDRCPARRGETIDLDGDLDEGVWARAVPASDFRQQDPDNGEAATEPTEVRIVFGDDALYMGVICFDSEPDRWLGYQRRRDGFLSSNDRFMWTIDTFLDGRSSYFFEMNPSGLMADALRGVGTSNRQWDGIWTERARRTGVRSLQPQLGYTVRPQNHAWIREFNFGGRVEWAFDPDDNTLLSRGGDITALQIDLHSQDSVALHVVPAYEVLEEDFDIAQGVTLPRGQDYSFMRYRVEANTANRRVIALRPRIEWGEFFSGDRLELGAEVAIRTRPGVMFTLAHEWNRVSLSEGPFYTKLYRSIAETQFSPWLSLVNNIHTIIRYPERSAGVAIAPSVDHTAGQRPVRRLPPQLARRPVVRSIHHVEPPSGVEGALHVSVLSLHFRRGDVPSGLGRHRLSVRP
jgi:hypothetical protein